MLTTNFPVNLYIAVLGWTPLATTISIFINRSPVAILPTMTVAVLAEDRSTPFKLMVSDPDDNRLIVFMSSSVPPPSKFKVVPKGESNAIQSQGQQVSTRDLSIEPASGFVGFETLVFRVSDGCLETFVTVNVNVSSGVTNSPPSSADVLGRTSKNVPIWIFLSGSDPDKEDFATLRVVSLVANSRGSFFLDESRQTAALPGVAIALGKLYYTPPLDEWSENDSPLGQIRYCAVDTHGAVSSPSTAGVIVAPGYRLVAAPVFNTPEDVPIGSCQKATPFCVMANALVQIFTF